MKVTHLYHSGVFIETEHHLLLIDYYQGYLTLTPNKPLYVFVSHNHYDHYNHEIFNIHHPNIHYILSDDVPYHSNALMVKAHQTYTIDDITIKTLKSTDEGVAFIIKVDQKVIYHAGDLHWWHWKDEDDIFNQYQKETYIQEMNSIDENIDLACIVIDKRLEENYLLGLTYFLKQVQCQYVLPIHYFGNYNISESLQKEKPDNPYQACILNVKHQNQQFELL